MTKDPNRLEGFFLSFTDEEADDIRAALKYEGYAPDGEGLKEFLIDSLFGDPKPEEAHSPTDEFITKARKFVTDNPETVRFGMNVATGLFNKIRKARR